MSFLSVEVFYHCYHSKNSNNSNRLCILLNFMYIFFIYIICMIYNYSRVYNYVVYIHIYYFIYTRHLKNFFSCVNIYPYNSFMKVCYYHFSDEETGMED